MHLLAAQQGTVSDGTEPVDPGQTPADVVVISAADSELAALSDARSALGSAAPSLRLMSLGHLMHPMSVDLHLDQCAEKSKIVIARVLGGAQAGNITMPVVEIDAGSFTSRGQG